MLKATAFVLFLGFLFIVYHGRENEERQPQSSLSINEDGDDVPVCLDSVNLFDVVDRGLGLHLWIALKICPNVLERWFSLLLDRALIAKQEDMVDRLVFIAAHPTSNVDLCSMAMDNKSVVLHRMIEQRYCFSAARVIDHCGFLDVDKPPLSSITYEHRVHARNCAYLQNVFLFVNANGIQA